MSHGLIRPDLAEAFVDHGPDAVDWIESVTDLRFAVVEGFPDYHPEQPGGRAGGGRSLDPGLFPFGRLGEWADRVVRPAKNPHLTLHETDLGGGDGRIDREVLAARRRDDQRGCGAALVGGLLAALLDRGVEPRLEHRAVDLLLDGGAVTGVGVVDAGRRRARSPPRWCGDRDRRVRVGSHAGRRFLRGPDGRCGVVPGNTGDGLRMAMRAGARLGLMREAWWVPTLHIPGDELFGRPRAQIVLRERTLPRSIMVNRHGRRFANEAANYNAFGGAFHQFDPTSSSTPTCRAGSCSTTPTGGRTGSPGPAATRPPPWVARRRRPRRPGRRRSASPPTRCVATVARWNGFVAAGHDADFGRGDSALRRLER